MVTDSTFSSTPFAFGETQTEPQAIALQSNGHISFPKDRSLE
jgi:hypothetical protein